MTSSSNPSVRVRIGIQVTNAIMKLAMNGIPKRSVLLGAVSVINAISLYLMQPENLFSKLTTMGISTIGAWGLTEGAYYTAVKTRDALMNYFFTRAIKDIPECTEGEKREISNLLDSLLGPNKN